MGAELGGVALRDIAAAAGEAAGVPGRVVDWPLAEARDELGPLADAMLLDVTADPGRTRERLGWDPHSPGVLADLRSGSYRPA